MDLSEEDPGKYRELMEMRSDDVAIYLGIASALRMAKNRDNK